MGCNCGGSFVHGPNIWNVRVCRMGKNLVITLTLTPGWRRVGPHRVESLAVERVCICHVILVVRHWNSQRNSSDGS